MKISLECTYSNENKLQIIGKLEDKTRKNINEKDNKLELIFPLASACQN